MATFTPFPFSESTRAYEDVSSIQPTTVEMEGVSPSAEDIGRLVLVIASYVIGFLGIFGNSIVILVCTRYPLRGVTNILVCNQSLIDLFSSIVFVLRYGIFTNVPLPDNSQVAEFVCKFWISEYLLWALAVASTGNLICLTIERYIAVFHPITYRQNITPLKAKLIAVLPWIVGMLHELPWGMSHVVRQDGCSHQWWSDHIGFVIGVIAPINHYVLPLLIMAFVYTRIFHKLQKSGRASSGNSRESKRSLATDRASRNVIKTMFMVSLTYLICWGPNEILYLYSNMGGHVDFGGVFALYTAVSALFNMCVNPFLYALNYQDFRAKLGKVFALFCPDERAIGCPCSKLRTKDVHSPDSTSTVATISSNV